MRRAIGLELRHLRAPATFTSTTIAGARTSTITTTSTGRTANRTGPAKQVASFSGLTSMAEAAAAAGDAGAARAQSPLVAGGKDTQQCAKEEAPLPPLSAKEFAIYNSMADHMNYWHNNFRSTWTTLHEACAANKRPAGMTARAFLATGLEFCHHLHMHHSIEEAHIFPVLAARMPAFRKELELLSQHREIHKGMDKMDAYLRACRAGERELRLGELKEVMDGFGEVLWRHLDEEVAELGADNMRKYWSLDEMRRMPM